jgi:hypothetical protein
MVSGKMRSKLGDWLDQNNITQEWLVITTKLNRKTISSLCNAIDSKPMIKTRKVILDVLQGIDSSLKSTDLW